ncbi:MAG: hypothetical protein HY527_09045 [Betaproteobacteria bacterium]|nr:hypothetical protein [Betaproteobacteria bacterium]
MNPRGPESGQNRVILGGAAPNGPLWVRAASRDYDNSPPYGKGYLIGFRCAKDAPK